MNTIKFFVLAIFLVACTSDTETSSPEPLETKASECTSSTLPDTSDEWSACREVNFDSWPVFCEGGAVPTSCDFAVDMEDGSTVTCRPAGGCS